MGLWSLLQYALFLFLVVVFVKPAGGYLLPGFFPEYHTTPMTPDLAMNTGISFSTTTTLAGTAVVVGGMSYFAALALGPIVEHLMMTT